MPLRFRITRTDNEDRNAIFLVSAFEILQNLRWSVWRRCLSLDIKHNIVVWVRRNCVRLLASILLEDLDTEPAFSE